MWMQYVIMWTRDDPTKHMFLGEEELGKHRWTNSYLYVSVFNTKKEAEDEYDRKWKKYPPIVSGRIEIVYLGLGDKDICLLYPTSQLTKEMKHVHHRTRNHDGSD